MTRLLAIWRAHPWISGAFLVALALTLFFGTRMVLFTVYWADPAHRDQALRGWMTPGYVAQSWDVPRETLAEALGPLVTPGKRQTLDRIAAENGVPLDDLIARLEAAIAAARAGE